MSVARARGKLGAADESFEPLRRRLRYRARPTVGGKGAERVHEIWTSRLKIDHAGPALSARRGLFGGERSRLSTLENSPSALSFGSAVPSVLPSEIARELTPAWKRSLGSAGSRSRRARSLLSCHGLGRFGAHDAALSVSAPTRFRPI